MGRRKKKSTSQLLAIQERQLSALASESSGSEPSAPSAADIATATHVLETLVSSGLSSAAAPSLRSLRKAVFAYTALLTNSSTPGGEAKWIARASEALRSGRYELAVEVMDEAGREKALKLGTVQRWVRDADFAGGNRGGVDGLNWTVIDSILRAAGQNAMGERGKVVDGCLDVWPVWEASKKGCAVEGEAVEGGGEVSVVTVEERWKGMRKMSIFATTARVMANVGPVVRTVEVPWIEGAFFMQNVLSVGECAAFVEAAGKMDFVGDAEYAVNPEASEVEGQAAEGVIWLASDELVGAMYERVREHLPQSLHGGDLAGLNARFRVYRYQQGAVYRPHVDGAWPGSGIVDGKYAFDAFGDRWSRLTFLLYLNEDFTGGATTFFAPSGVPGVLAARGIAPRSGSVLAFPHGDTAGSLVHEGSEVRKGVKYIIRSDVLYTRERVAGGKRHGEFGVNAERVGNKKITKRL